MDVAHQIEQELQVHQPLAFRGVGIPQLLCELVYLVDDAIILRSMARRCQPRQGRSAEACLFQIGIIGIEFHVMPLRRRRSSFLAIFAQCIGPGRLTGDVGLGPIIGFVGREDIGNLLLDWRGLGLQKPIGDKRNDLVSFASPGPALCGLPDKGGRGKAEKGTAKPKWAHRDLRGGECVLDDRNLC